MDVDDDRRRAPRATVSTRAMVLARHNDGVAFTIESISTGGARLVGPLALGLGEAIQILFEIDDRPVEVTGEVVRVDRDELLVDRIAVRFISLDPATRTQIRALVRRTLELEDDGVEA